MRQLAVTLLGLALACDSTSPVQEPPTLRNKVLFSSNRDGFFQLYSMNQDGSGVTILPASIAGPVLSAAISRDGRKIAFTLLGDIWTMDADVTGHTTLTNDPASNAFPSWSPDGGRIAFTTSRDGNSEVYVMNADGTSQVNLSNSPASDQMPAWSPDGAEILFTSNRDGNWEVYAMNADGSAPRNLSRSANPDYVREGAWSHDGTRIAFTSERFPGSYVIVMNRDGTQLLLDTPAAPQGGWPTWSPGDSLIAFENGGHIHHVHADGSGLTTITSGPALDLFPIWSP